MKCVWKILLFVLFFNLLSASAGEIELSKEENLWLKNTQKIRVRVARNLLPVQDIEDGRFVGVGVEYIREFAKKFGLEIEFIGQYSWSEALKRIEKREGIDILLQARKTKKRAEKMLFTQPYVRYPYVIVQKKGDDYNSLRALDGKRVALVKDYAVNKYLKKEVPEFHHNAYDNILKALISVSTDKSDAYVGNLALVAMLMEKYGLANLRISSLVSIPTKGYSMVSGKDWSAFISLFDKFYNSLEGSVHDTIRRKYTPIFTKDIEELPQKSIQLNEKEALYVRNTPSITVSNELDWYPYDFNEHGTPQGYVVDLVRLLAKKIGLKVEFKTAAWPALHEAFKKKELDILYPVRKTKKRQSYALFGEPLMKTKNVFITRKDRKDIKNLDDLKGKRLALGRGWTLTKYIKNLYPKAKVIEYDTSVEMYEAVAFDLADVTIDDYMTASYIINKEMLGNLKVGEKVKEETLFDPSLYMMFQKSNPLLQSLFSKALDAVTAQEMYELKNKWVHAIEEKEPNVMKINLTKKEKEYLVKRSEIKMCIDPAWMPLEANRDGEHIGMSADYMKLLEKSIGTPIKMVPTKTWLESIEFAKQRRCDIYSLAMPTPERKLYMDFTKPYLSIPLVLVTRPSEIFYADVTSIVDKKIGIVKGYAYGEILQTRYPNMQLVKVENVNKGMEQVASGDIFGFIGTLATVGYKIKEDYFGTLKIAGKFDENWELGVGVRNDEPLLKSVFEKAINSIPQEEHHRILNKWISLDYRNKKIDYTLVWQILLAISFVGVLLLYRQYKLKEYNKKLQFLSITDALTGVYNRLKLDEVLEYEKRFFDRYGRDLSIILIDVDDFKRVNDFYGHHKGDDVLKQIASILKTYKRNSDTLGRWGGEEFLIICPETDSKGACKLAEKCRVAIESFSFENSISQSASFGVAQFQKDETIEKVFHRADISLYEAKVAGKNCVRNSEKG